MLSASSLSQLSCESTSGSLCCVDVLVLVRSAPSSFSLQFFSAPGRAIKLRESTLCPHVALSGSAPPPSPRRRLCVETWASCGSPLRPGQLITEAVAGPLRLSLSRTQRGGRRDVRPSVATGRRGSQGSHPVSTCSSASFVKRLQSNEFWSQLHRSHHEARDPHKNATSWTSPWIPLVLSHSALLTLTWVKPPRKTTIHLSLCHSAVSVPQSL